MPMTSGEHECAVRADLVARHMRIADRKYHVAGHTMTAAMPV